MFRRIAYILSIFVLIVVTDMHLFIAQVVAWGEMVQTYSQEYGLEEGVKRTFDGEHPCCMCKKIAREGQKDQSKIPILKLEKKPELILLSGVTVGRKIEPPTILTFPPWITFCPHFHPAPELPPPEVA